jgi:thiamine pyrophosphate-dependent acetolactate synthase large subunit-like protein
MAAEIRDCLPRDAIVTEDAELTMGITRQIVPSFFPRQRLNSGTTGCMGTGFPYAVGAKLACPDKPVVAILGDYAFGAAAMEVETCARLGINVTVIVSNNAGISAHTMQSRFPEGSPPVGAMLPVDYEKMAEMVGGHAERITDPSEIQPALQRALASETISLINILTDPDAGKGRRSSMYI